MVYEIIQPSALKNTETEILVLGLPKGEPSRKSYEFPEDLQNYIDQILKYGDFDASQEHPFLLYPNEKKRIILFGGYGKNAEPLSLPQYLARIKKLIGLMKTLSCKSFSIELNSISVTGLDHHDLLGHFVRLWEQQSAPVYVRKKEETPPKCLPPILKFVMPCDELCPLCRETITYESAVGRGIAAAGYLADQPPNLCTPEHLSKAALSLADQYKYLSYEGLNEESLSAEGLSGYLAVGSGSKNRPMLSILTYKPQETTSSALPKVAIVGKGLTFDAGGISLKPAARMDAMKYDMCGAAAVLGIIQIIADLQLPMEVIGLMAGCENMPDGASYRPGDILKMHSGKYVEVLNTDAEGRIVLADVLSYTQSRYQPNLIIDMATLTGACVVALGHYRSGLFSNDPTLAHTMSQAAEAAADPVWTLPLDSVYEEALESDVADLNNCGGREGSSITAACFLRAFINHTPWMHLDIAGTAFTSGKKQKATGRPIGAVMRFLKVWCQKEAGKHSLWN